MLAGNQRRVLYCIETCGPSDISKRQFLQYQSTFLRLGDLG